MRTFSRNSILGQYLDSFWLPFSSGCSNSCHIFWLAVFKTFIIAFVTWVLSLAVSPLLAAVVVALQTGFIAVPLQVLFILLGILSAALLIYFTGLGLSVLFGSRWMDNWIHNIGTKLSNSSVVVASKDYYEGSKERYCIPVQFTDDKE